MKVYHFSDLAQHGQTQQDGISIGYNGVDILGAHTLHGHDYYEMTYMCDGEGVQIINQKPYYVQKGSVIVLSPRDVHLHYPLTEFCPLTCCFVRTDPLGFLPPETAFPIVVHLDQRYQLQIEQLFFLLNEELKNKMPYHSQAAWHFLDSVFLVIQRNLRKDPTLLMWDNVLSYIVNSLKDVDFATAVQLYGCSSSHFCRMFKRDFSMTFTEFVTGMRIQRAKELLTNTSYSVSEIYEQCGYNSNQRFYFDFKKATGVTPTKYRKREQKTPQSQTSSVPPPSDTLSIRQNMMVEQDLTSEF